MKKTFLIPLALVLLLVATSAVYYYYSKNLLMEERLFTASGTIEATAIDVSSMVPAEIVSVPVSEGDNVKSGKLLVSLDNRILKNQYKQAVEAVAAADANLDAANDKGGDAEIDLAKAQLRSAKAAQAVAKVQLGFAKITSPSPGTVLNVAVNPGETASPGTPLVTIGRLDTVKLVIFIPEDKLGKIKLGQNVDVSVDSYPKKIFKGTISKINSQAEFTPTNIETKDQRVNLVFGVKVELPNPGLKLKPGMPADATLELISN